MNKFVDYGTGKKTSLMDSIKEFMMGIKTEVVTNQIDAGQKEWCHIEVIEPTKDGILSGRIRHNFGQQLCDEIRKIEEKRMITPEEFETFVVY